MDFESMLIQKNFDRYLKVRTDRHGGINFESDIKTEIFLNECFNILEFEEKSEIIEVVETAITGLKFDFNEALSRISDLKEEGDIFKSHIISQNEFANIERKKKRKFLKNWLLEKRKIILNGEEKNIEDSNKFLVALDFANGKIDNLYKQGFNNTEIAKKLYANRHVGFRPYISASIQRLGTGGNKNVFNDNELINYVKQYCAKNNIKIIENFKPIKQLD